jgi:DNA polymerase III subunit gamma/tau
MTDSPALPYRVLARAYRPQTFAELIGQDAMVQTLGNAIRRERIAHAFLMTGVRGVGKTTTARLIAKALNCIGTDGQGGATIDPCGQCDPCRAIAEGRHIDVIEMDAASHTGIDDVREIIEAVRYTPVSARFKMYIIDEAHMLSKQAWNGFLKTLEEPPEHVKFLFATTEVNKVPVTVLSRCQRFDLRRIPIDLLHGHFRTVLDKEQVGAEDEALHLIAQAAEGSARDGLSILDQAIAHADQQEGRPSITAMQVRKMLGLTDNGSVRRLFAAIVDGQTDALLDGLAEQDSLGVAPNAIMVGLMELVHAITLAKAQRGAAGQHLPESERAALEHWAAALSYPVLHRLWQMLLKGEGEVAQSGRPMAALEMALLRLVHAASLPDPSELARLLREGGGAAPDAQASARASETLASRRYPADFVGLVEQLRPSFARLAIALTDDVGLINYAPPALELKPLRPLDAAFGKALSEALKVVFETPWAVTFSDAACQPSLYEQAALSREKERQTLIATPLAAAAIAAFPQAVLLDPDTDQPWSERA